MLWVHEIVASDLSRDIRIVNGLTFSEEVAKLVILVFHSRKHAPEITWFTLVMQEAQRPSIILIPFIK